MKRLWFDTETYSPIPLTRGTDVYAREAEIMIAAWAIDHGAVRVADLTAEPFPEELRQALLDPGTIIMAHNAYFDRKVMEYAWGITVPFERWHCTMAQAYSNSYPGSLGLLCDVLDVKTKKQEGGGALIQLFCKPRPAKQKLRRATRETHPTEWAQFLAYAGDDVGAMRDAFYAMPIRNYRGEEKALWNLDQEINDTGFLVDLEFMNKAIELLKIAKQESDDRVSELTSGEVARATQRDKFILHMLNEHGVLLDSLRADDLEELLEDERLPIVVRELLQLRIMSAMNSTAKFTRLKNSVGPDGRLRGTRQFNGAARTGRSAGRIFNPLNLRRPTMKAYEIEHCIELIKAGRADDVELLYCDLREACSNGLRGLIIAPPGRKLVVCDWSNIEGRMAAWLVGENWKLDAFRAFDTIVGVDAKGKPLRGGPDLYKLIYSKSFGCTVEEVDDFKRQIGKGEELSMQYGGGVGAFIAVSYSYGLDLDELGRVMPSLAPVEALTEAAKTWEWAVDKKRTLGLERDVYIACDTVKRLYREANANIADGWKALENAFRLALTYPGEKHKACRCEFEYRSGWLMVKLPSGRHLMYPNPRIDARGGLSYCGQVNKQWRRIKTYGGKLLENITQAASRDILVHSMLRVKREHPESKIVLDVYDEIVVEAPEAGEFNLDVLKGIMVHNPDWATGLPIAAEGFEAKRYAKH